MGIAVLGAAVGPGVNGAGAITVGGIGLMPIDPIMRLFITRFGAMVPLTGKMRFSS